jgi:hypothetical protein
MALENDFHSVEVPPKHLSERLGVKPITKRGRPTRSAKTRVTVFRISLGAADWGVSAAAQKRQNRAISGLF